MPDENRRFERLTATRETLSLVYGNPDVYEQVINMLTGNNRFILEAGFESNINERYKIVQQKLCELNTLQFAVTVHLFPPLKFYMLLKERHELCNDNAACTIFDERIKGEPDADDEISKLGLLGLWEIEDNRQADEMLDTLGTTTEEEFKRTIDESLEFMIKDLEERMEKLKTEKQTPDEPTPKHEAPAVKEDIIMPPSDLDLEYMDPADYEKWEFWNFEVIIPGLELEDLQELSEYVGLSKKMTDQEQDDIRAIISKRINEIQIEGF